LKRCNRASVQSLEGTALLVLVPVLGLLLLLGLASGCARWGLQRSGSWKALSGRAGTRGCV
jgi:hypothetical protein